jgi:hypothetical protein
LRINYAEIIDGENEICTTSLMINTFNHPVNKPYSIAIKPTNKRKELESKMLVAKVDSAGVFGAVGGKFAEGWVTVNTRSLGRFTIAVDTTGPIAFEPFWRLDDLTQTNMLVIPVKDDLSGLAKYNCFISDGWICGEFNASRNEILIYFENGASPELPINLKIQLTDQKENASEWHFQVTK